MDFLATGSSLILIFLGFCMLIVVHELGHYVAAKWAGIRVEGFSIGMGPPLFSYRRGVGWRVGSTDPIVRARHGVPATAMHEEELARHGLGETEWTFRVFPLGGFVKMLGQEDANPSAVSDAPRSYGRTPIGKRMVVVSAGVCANLLLAVLLFLIAFLVGVRFPAPIVGGVASDLPAATAVARNAAEAGLPPDAPAGLQPGDRIESIDGAPAQSFLDAVIAAAMARPDQAIEIVVCRPGVETPLLFSIIPKRDSNTGLLSIGIGAASSTSITSERSSRAFVANLLEATRLADAGVQSGMRLVEAGGQPIGTFQELLAALDSLAESAQDYRVTTRWTGADGAVVEAALPIAPQLERFSLPATQPGAAGREEIGLAGLLPLIEVMFIMPDSPNESILRPGDVLLRAGRIDAPTLSELKAELATHRRGKVELTLLRDGSEVVVTALVNRDGQLDIMTGIAWSVPLVSRVLPEALGEGPEPTMRPTPAAGLDLFPRSRILEVDGRPIRNWSDLRDALVEAAGGDTGSDAETIVPILIALPVGNAVETQTLRLTPADVRRLAELGWTTPVAGVFDPEFVVLRATGPLDAIRMGMRETWKMALHVYLTIDRLVRRTVSIEQLHGPVGIFHVGTRVADQGFMYLIFFLAAISVNLAVINFLPIPIVDGGLFLFLVYEKVRGRPPSIAFQNAATAVGLLLIASVFLVTFYNDIARLLR